MGGIGSFLKRKLAYIKRKSKKPTRIPLGLFPIPIPHCCPSSFLRAIKRLSHPASFKSDLKAAEGCCWIFVEEEVEAEPLFGSWLIGRLWDEEVVVIPEIVSSEATVSAMDFFEKKFLKFFGIFF